MSDKYMKNLTFANIAKACEGTYIGDETQLDTTITGAVIDSRQVKEGYLFIPIKGERVDGHKFIPTVFEQGRQLCSLSMSLRIRQAHMCLLNQPPMP